MQHEVICPICKKDLTEAIDILGHNSLEIWDYHMAIHKEGLIQDMSFQLDKYKNKVPKELKDAYDAYDEGMKALNNTRHLIKATMVLG